METSEEETNIDIYGDICDFDLGDEVDKLKSENKELAEQINVLEKTVETLQGVISKLKENQDHLKQNISALFLTARSEIERKDRMITELRSEIDNICFRRNIYNKDVNKEYNKRKTMENASVELSKAKKFKHEDRKDEGSHDRNKENSNMVYDAHKSGDGRNRNRSIEREERLRDDRGRSRNRSREREEQYRGGNNRDMEKEQRYRGDNRGRGRNRSIGREERYRGRNCNDRDRRDSKHEYRKSDNRDSRSRGDQRRLKCGQQDLPSAEYKCSNDTETVDVIDLEAKAPIEAKVPMEVIDLDELQSNIKGHLENETSSLPRTLSESSTTENDENRHKPKKRQLNLLAGLVKKKKEDDDDDKTTVPLIRRKNNTSRQRFKVKKDGENTKEVSLESEKSKPSIGKKGENFEVYTIDLTEGDDLTQEDETPFLDGFIVKEEDDSQDANTAPAENVKTSECCKDGTKETNVSEVKSTDSATDCGKDPNKDKAPGDNKKEAKDEINSSKGDGKRLTKQEIVTKDASQIPQKSSPIDAIAPKNEESKDSSTEEPAKSSKDQLKFSAEIEKEPAKAELLPDLTKHTELEQTYGLQKNVEALAENIKKITTGMNMPSLLEECIVACPKGDGEKSTRAVNGNESTKKIVERVPSKKKILEGTTNLNVRQNTTRPALLKKLMEVDSSSIKDPSREGKTNSAKEETRDAKTEKNVEPATAAPRKKRGASIEAITTKLEKKLHSLFDSEGSPEEGEIIDKSKDDTKPARHSSRDKESGIELKIVKWDDDPSVQSKSNSNSSKEERMHVAKRESRRASMEWPKEHDSKIDWAQKIALKLEEANKNVVTRETNPPGMVEGRKTWRIPKLSQSEQSNKTSRTDSARDPFRVARAVEQKGKRNESETIVEGNVLEATDVQSVLMPGEYSAEGSTEENQAKTMTNQSLRVVVKKQDFGTKPEDKTDLAEAATANPRLNKRRGSIESQINGEESRGDVETKANAQDCSNLKAVEDKVDSTDNQRKSDTPKQRRVLKKVAPNLVGRRGCTKESSKSRGENQVSGREDVATEMIQMAMDCSNPNNLKDKIESSANCREDDAKQTQEQRKAGTTANSRSGSIYKEGSSKVVKEAENQSRVDQCSKIVTKQESRIKTQIAIDCSSEDKIESTLNPRKDDVKRRQDLKKVGSTLSSRRHKEDSSKTEGAVENQSKVMAEWSKNVAKEETQAKARDCNGPETLMDKIESSMNAWKDDVKRQDLKKVGSTLSSRRRSTHKEDSSKTEGAVENQSRVVAECAKVAKEETQAKARDSNSPETLKDKIESAMNAWKDDVKRQDLKKVGSTLSSRRRSTHKEDSSKTEGAVENQSRVVDECAKVAKEETQAKARDSNSPETLKDKIESAMNAWKDDVKQQDLKKVGSTLSSRRRSTHKEDSSKTEGAVENQSRVVAECAKVAKEETQAKARDSNSPETLKDKIESAMNAWKDDVKRGEFFRLEQSFEDFKKVGSTANVRRRSTLKEGLSKTVEISEKEYQSKIVAECPKVISKEESRARALDCSNVDTSEDEMESPKNPQRTDRVSQETAAVQRRAASSIQKKTIRVSLKAASLKTAQQSRNVKSGAMTEYSETDKSGGNKEDNDTKGKAQQSKRTSANTAQNKTSCSGSKISLDKTTDKSARNRDKNEESQTDLSMDELADVKTLKIGIPTNVSKAKVICKKIIEAYNDDSDSSSSPNANRLLEEERTKMVHDKLDDLIKNYQEDASVKSMNDINSKRIECDKNAERRRKSPACTSADKTAAISPGAVTRRRITPTPVTDKGPICSFKNILENAGKSPPFPKDISPLHLTDDGEIPVLHLDENHINNLPTESNINDKNIMNLLDTMNISNLECDTPKFKNLASDAAVSSGRKSPDGHFNISPVKRNSLTFENIITNVTSTPVVTSGKPDEGLKSAATHAVSSAKAVTLPALPQSVRRRRRCRLIIAD